MLRVPTAVLHGIFRGIFGPLFGTLFQKHLDHKTRGLDEVLKN